MKNHLTALARDVDAFCARLNDGLAAVAILLAFLVLTVAVIRVADYLPQTPVSMQTTFQSTGGY